MNFSIKHVLLLFITFLINDSFGQTSLNTITVSPNPCAKRTLISFTIASSDTISLGVYNLIGQQIITLRSNVFLSAGNYQDSLALDNFPDGMYLVFLMAKSQPKPLATSKVVKSASTGIPLINNSQAINVYPNPVNDKLQFEFGSFEVSDYKIELINSLGQVVNVLSSVSQKQEMDLSFLTNGIYYLKIQNNSEQRVFKIVKK